MIDIETLGLAASSKILSIGAVAFTIGTDVTYPFYRTVETKAGQEYRTTTDSTIKWWSEQDESIIQEAHSGVTLLRDVLFMLDNFIRYYPKDTLIWCKGVNFDFPILEHAFIENNITIPWKYYQLMDCRTAFNMFKDRVPKEPNSNAHNALEDAIAQAKQLQKCLILADGGIL